MGKLKTLANGHGKVWTNAVVIVELLLIVCLPLVGWTLAKSVEHESRISVLESRTAEIPPEWWKEQVQEALAKIEAKIDKLDGSMRQHMMDNP